MFMQYGGTALRSLSTLILLPLILAVGVACRGDADAELILATTTSTQDSGLLDELVPMFEEKSGLSVKVIAVGSGAALEMGRSGNADVLLVHSPAAEQALVTDRFGIDRTRVMYNDFIIIGPPMDPAGIAGTNDAVAALTAIAEADAPFYSRGDDSGTHAKELSLWEATGIEPGGESWYSEVGQGMGATLTIAAESEGYSLSDRATWLSAADPAVLALLVECDPRLFNVYHVIVVNPEAHPDLDLNSDGAQEFRAFLVEDDAQAVIAAFGADRFGQPLFVPYLEE